MGQVMQALLCFHVLGNVLAGGNEVGDIIPFVLERRYGSLLIVQLSVAVTIDKYVAKRLAVVDRVPEFCIKTRFMKFLFHEIRLFPHDLVAVATADTFIGRVDVLDSAVPVHNHDSIVRLLQGA